MRNIFKLKFLHLFLKSYGGRNNRGGITRYHRGNKISRFLFRLIDFYRRLWFFKGKILSIEEVYDRTGFLSLIVYRSGLRSYILAPSKVQIGMSLKIGAFHRFERDSSSIYPIHVSTNLKLYGNCSYLVQRSLGGIYHNIENFPYAGGHWARSAGMFLKLVNKRGSLTGLRSYLTFPGFVGLLTRKGKLIYLSFHCFATVGSVSNEHYYLNKVFNNKAGYSRIQGIRPKVRGVAKNPIDHPHGGGTAGGRPSVSRWGRLTKSSIKTRSLKKELNFRCFISRVNKIF